MCICYDEYEYTSTGTGRDGIELIYRKCWCSCSLVLSLQWASDLQRLLEEREGNGLRREQGRSQATGGREQEP